MARINWNRPVFTPDYNDPEVRMVRDRILNRYPERRARYTDELARGGLLGSGAGLGMYRQLDLDQENMISGAEGNVFARQSGQAFDLHKMRLMDELERRRRKEAQKQAMIGSLLGIGGKIAGMATLGGIGSLAGGGMMSSTNPLTGLDSSFNTPGAYPEDYGWLFGEDDG